MSFQTLQTLTSSTPAPPPAPSPGVNASIEYVLEVHSVSPRVGSLLGGTRLTVWGAGFSPNASLLRVSVGESH